MKKSNRGALYSILFLASFIQQSNANQIDGCYQLSSGSNFQLWEPNGNLMFNSPIEGAWVGRTNNSYSLSPIETASNPVIKGIKFSSINEDRENKQIVATGQIALFQNNTSPTMLFEDFTLRWDIQSIPSSTPGIIDHFTLVPVDSDGDGVIGSRLNLPFNYNFSFELELDSISNDQNQLTGCHRFTADSSWSTYTPQGNLISSSAVTGTIMSAGDSTYFVVPDPDDVQNRYFRNLKGQDLSATGQIQVNGRYSYWNYPEDDIAWTWKLDAIPDGSEGNTTFNLASEDSNLDGAPGIPMGGPTPLAPYNIALDINLELVEARPNEYGTYTVEFAEYNEGTTQLVVPELDDPLDITTYNDINLRGAVSYPTNPDGSIAGTGPLPVIVLVHGAHGTTYACEASSTGVINVNSYRGFDYLMKSLSSHGFVVFSINQDDIDAGPVSSTPNDRARLLLKHLAVINKYSQNIGSDPVKSILQGKLDMNRIGLAGLSQGGAAIALADYFDRDEGLNYNLDAILSLSPTSIATTHYPLTPWLLLSGAADGETGTTLMNILSNMPETHNYQASALWFYGGRHAFFNTNWTTHYNSDFGISGFEPFYMWADETRGGMPDGNWIGFNLLDTECGYTFFPIPFSEEIEPARQQQITDTVANAFFRLHLMGESGMERVITGELPIHGSHSVEKYWALKNPDHHTIDNFDALDGLNTAADINVDIVSWSNGFLPIINQGSTIQTPQEVESFKPDYGFKSPVSRTGTLVVAWQGSDTQWIEWNFSSMTGADATSYDYVGFDASQIYDNGTLNIFGHEKDITVALTDSEGNSSSVSLYEVNQGVPYPFEVISDEIHEAVLVPYRRSVMTAIRVPLNKYTGINLNNVSSIKLEFNGEGLIAIDNIQFTK